MYVCVYVCVCMYICMYVCMYVCTVKPETLAKPGSKNFDERNFKVWRFHPDLPNLSKFQLVKVSGFMVCTYVTYVFMYVCMYVRMCVCMFVCMYVCMYVYV